MAIPPLCFPLPISFSPGAGGSSSSKDEIGGVVQDIGGVVQDIGGVVQDIGGVVQDIGARREEIDCAYIDPSHPKHAYTRRRVKEYLDDPALDLADLSLIPSKCIANLHLTVHSPQDQRVVSLIRKEIKADTEPAALAAIFARLAPEIEREQQRSYVFERVVRSAIRYTPRTALFLLAGKEVGERPIQ